MASAAGRAAGSGHGGAASGAAPAGGAAAGASHPAAPRDVAHHVVRDPRVARVAMGCEGCGAK